MMKTLEKSLMADGSSSDMLLLKVLTAGNTWGMYCISSPDQIIAPFDGNV